METATHKDKHIKMKPRIYVLFVFDLDGECKFIKNKTLELLKKYVLGCDLGWVNRRFCIRKVRWCQYLINSAFLSFSWGCRKSALIAILKTPAGSISFNSWLRFFFNCHCMFSWLPAFIFYACSSVYFAFSTIAMPLLLSHDLHVRLLCVVE